MIYRLYMGDIFGHGIVSDDATPASDFGIFGNLIASRNNAASIWPHNPAGIFFPPDLRVTSNSTDLVQRGYPLQSWMVPGCQSIGSKLTQDSSVYIGMTILSRVGQRVVLRLEMSFSIQSAQKFEYGWSLMIRGTQRHSADSMMRPNPSRCMDAEYWAKQNRFATKLAFCRTSTLVTIGFASPVWHIAALESASEISQWLPGGISPSSISKTALHSHFQGSMQLCPQRGIIKFSPGKRPLMSFSQLLWGVKRVCFLESRSQGWGVAEGFFAHHHSSQSLLRLKAQRIARGEMAPWRGESWHDHSWLAR